jgi:hypothetical protein
MKIKSIEAIEVTDPRWLTKRFGDHYAPISTNTMLRIRSSIKDVHRVRHKFVSPYVEKLCQMIPVPPQGIDDAAFVFGYEDSDGKEVKGIAETDPALMKYIAEFPEEWAIVQKCLGLTRQKSKHACAFVLADEPIKNFIPLTTVGDVTVTQYTAKSVEAVGGLKMDFLVVNSLNDIAACVKLIQKRTGYIPKDEFIKGIKVPAHQVVPHRGHIFDIWNLPEDQGVFADICAGKTETVFQFNTPSARQWLKEFVDVVGRHTLKSIEGLAAFTALDRPGPLDARVQQGEVSRNMLQEFAARSRGEEPIGANQVLDQMLPETYGVIVYQEQLQRVFQEVGGTTGIQANNFRDDIGKKRMQKVMAWKDVFMPGAIQRLGEEEAHRLWNMMETFGQYGFNKSHSICYVIIGYACAWLKHHYPLEWWTSVLSHATRNEIDEKFWEHCGHMIDMPDIKLSGDGFEIQGDRIRAPLSLLNGVGPAAHKELCEGRPYIDMADFCQKIQDRKIRGAKLNAKGKMQKGRSSLGPALVCKLIVTGVADALFPPETPMSEKLQAYADHMARVEGKKKAKKLDDRFTMLTAIQILQMKKQILPSYSEDLIPVVSRLVKDNTNSQHEGSYVWQRGGRLVFHTKDSFGNNQDQDFTIFTGQEIEDLNKIKMLPHGGLKVAALAFVVDAKVWRYGPTKDKQACKITFEVDGHRFQLVKWPNREGKLVGVPQELVGSIVAVTLVKWKAEKEFSLDDIYVIQPPLGDKTEESQESSKE